MKKSLKIIICVVVLIAVLAVAAVIAFKSLGRYTSYVEQTVSAEEVLVDFQNFKVELEEYSKSKGFVSFETQDWTASIKPEYYQTIEIDDCYGIQIIIRYDEVNRNEYYKVIVCDDEFSGNEFPQEIRDIAVEYVNMISAKQITASELNKDISYIERHTTSDGRINRTYGMDDSGESIMSIDKDGARLTIEGVTKNGITLSQIN